MSVEERIEHRDRIMSFRTSEQCDVYVDDHHRQMQARAMDRGQILPASPRSTVCARLLRAGRLN